MNNCSDVSIQPSAPAAEPIAESLPDIEPPPVIPPQPAVYEPIPVQIQQYTVEQAAAAANELRSAIAASTDSQITQLVEVTSAVEFSGIDVDDVPDEFVHDFQVSMAGRIGGGGVVAPAEIACLVSAAGAGRRRLQDTGIVVDFAISAPATMADTAASLVANVATGPPLSVGNVTVDLSSMEVPIVMEYDDCEGSFTQCAADCRQIFVVTVAKTGIGADCEHEHYFTRPCTGDYCVPEPAPAIPEAPVASASSGGGSSRSNEKRQGSADSADSVGASEMAGVAVAGIGLFFAAWIVCGREDEGEKQPKKGSTSSGKKKQKQKKSKGSKGSKDNGKKKKGPAVIENPMFGGDDDSDDEKAKD
jgi:hypothetical protein